MVQNTNTDLIDFHSIDNSTDFIHYYVEEDETANMLVDNLVRLLDEDGGLEHHAGQFMTEFTDTVQYLVTQLTPDKAQIEITETHSGRLVAEYRSSRYVLLNFRRSLVGQYISENGELPDQLDVGPRGFIIERLTAQVHYLSKLLDE